jgi:uncharacterized membrane protein YbhN (UPF0104 family)
MSTFVSINASVAFIVFVTSLLLFLSGALNLWLILNSIHHIPLILFIQSYSYSYIVNLFTPGQLGDISVAIFLKKHGIYYSRSTLAYVVDKAISMVFILLLGYIGAKVLLKDVAGPLWLFAIPPICVVFALACMVLILYIPYKSSQIGRAKQFLLNIYNEALLWDTKYKAIILNIILTIARWLLLSLTYYLAFCAFGIEVTWPEVGIIPIISTLIGYMPISVGGIGTVELCAVYLFSLISVDRVYVIDVYIFLRFITYVQAGLILGLSNWRFRQQR